LCQADREVVLAAVGRHGLALEFADAELQADHQVRLRLEGGSLTTTSRLERGITTKNYRMHFFQYLQNTIRFLKDA
jgi:hypothetical protein